MKRVMQVLIIALCTTFAVSIWGQASSPSPSPTPAASSADIYIKTLYIVKVYPAKLGYKVTYWTEEGTLGTTYLPLSWFSGTAGKGVYLTGYGREIPFMELVYVDGKFSYVKLHVPPTFNDPAWGALSNGEDLTGKFSSDTLQLQF